ncbi:unnamed protein product [Amaranthus hypochondriacus]
MEGQVTNVVVGSPNKPTDSEGFQVVRSKNRVEPLRRVPGKSVEVMIANGFDALKGVEGNPELPAHVQSKLNSLKHSLRDAYNRVPLLEVLKNAEDDLLQAQSLLHAFPLDPGYASMEVRAASVLKRTKQDYATYIQQLGKMQCSMCLDLLSSWLGINFKANSIADLSPRRKLKTKLKTKLLKTLGLRSYNLSISNSSCKKISNTLAKKVSDSFNFVLLVFVLLVFVLGLLNGSPWLKPLAKNLDTLRTLFNFEIWVISSKKMVAASISNSLNKFRSPSS